LNQSTALASIASSSNRRQNMIHGKANTHEI
jgi:hypothetical protein